MNFTLAIMVTGCGQLSQPGMARRRARILPQIQLSVNPVPV